MLLLAYRNLVTEKTRFAFSAAGIGFAVFLITMMLGLYQGWNNKVGAFVEDVDADAWIARQGATDFITAVSLLPKDKCDEFQAAGGVEACQGLIVRPMVFYNSSNNGKETVLQLVGYNTQNEVSGPVDCEKGDCTPEGNEIVIDTVLARTRGVSVGDMLRSGSEEVRVIGLSSGGNFAFITAGFMELEAARELLDMQDYATFFAVDLDDGTNADQWTADVEAGDPVVIAYTGDEFSSATRDRILKNVIPILALIVGLALVVGVAITSLTIYTATVEKTREFGVMKAIGFNNIDLFKLVLSQSFLIGFLGFVFGVVLTVVLSRFIDRVVPQFIVLMRPIDIGLVLLATLLMAALSSIVPARRVGNVDPAVVFRGG
jgi:putative ABC transport system permease protein